MISMEKDIALTYEVNDPNAILREYGELMESLKEDLSASKIEQNKIRSELETYRQGNKIADNAIRDYFFRIHSEECCDNNLHENEKVKNLEERIAILQVEKDSVFQLWQVALKAVDSLEKEMRILKDGNNGMKIYEEQVNTIKGTYTEAIKALEEKLLQAKENFIKQKTLWESSKEKITELKKEKEEITCRLKSVQYEWIEKDKRSQQNIDSLKAELAAAKAEIEKQLSLKLELETKLQDIKRFAANVVAKDEETKCKMTEAIELVEFAIKEKDMALQREIEVLEEKSKIEKRLTELTEHFNNMLQEEMAKIKSIHDQDISKYLLEIKELKSELHQTATLLDRSQRECKLVDEELARLRQKSEDTIHKSNIKIDDLERRLKDTEYQIENADDICKKKYSFEIKQLQEVIADLEKKLSVSYDKLRLLEQKDINNIEQSMKQIDAKAKEAVEQYNNLEWQLSKTIDDKKGLVIELQSLQATFGDEIKKRDHEKLLLEKRIFELEMDLQKTKSSIQHVADDVAATGPLTQRVKSKYDVNIVAQTSDHYDQYLVSAELNKLQERFDKRIRELSHHVETHQRLSKKWREEAKFLATKFQTKCKELRSEISALRRENNELQKELLINRQHLAQCGTQIIHRYEQRDDIR